ncbi:caspase family protein [Nocardia sp. NPDC019255]|uniref:caspase family protein n=1 Tax=Nocardia sp. NPDC019255 TaxID=3154591 RepID=UPI0033EF8419
MTIPAGIQGKGTKTVVVSIGVSRYTGSVQLHDIDCALVDAQNLHRSLKLGLGDAYDMWRSLTMLDPSANEAQAILTSTSRRLNCGELLIVYFSGHAILRRGTLMLAFSDALDDGRGQLSVSEVANACAEVNAVLILDCCHSGAAASLANKPNILTPTTISVLASGAAFATALHLPEGSPFTLELIGAIEDSAVTGQELSLVSLAKKLNVDKDVTDRCIVNVAEGSEDAILIHEAGDAADVEETAQKFIEKLSSVDRVARELMWYSLAELPQMYQSGVIGNIVHAGIAREASWLVRRAIGSFLDGQPSHSRIRNEVAGALIQSEHWVEVCVGLIAARRLLGVDGDLRSGALKVLASSIPSNATWLASLYLTDCGQFNFDFVEHSQLAKTAWGITEILEHYLVSGRDRNWLSRWALDLAAANNDEDIISEVATHLKLSNFAVPRNVSDSRLSGQPLFRYLYSLKPRGKLSSSGGKWLLSSLLGNWRRDSRSNLRTYASSKRPREILQDLEQLGALPSVSLRTAVLLDPWIGEHPDRVDSVLSWGLVDDHPWVRRAAVELAADGRIGPITNLLVDMAKLPGQFDLLLTLNELGGDNRMLLERIDLTPVEREALDRDGCRIL